MYTYFNVYTHTESQCDAVADEIFCKAKFIISTSIAKNSSQDRNDIIPVCSVARARAKRVNRVCEHLSLKETADIADGKTGPSTG
jgi:hypothetical protein